jgi:hypothetical protein
MIRKPTFLFTEAVKMSHGALTERKIKMAIKKGKVRHDKPSPQRLGVHIQDILSLIKKSEVSENIKEEAARMYSEYIAIHQEKIRSKLDLS